MASVMALGDVSTKTPFLCTQFNLINFFFEIEYLLKSRASAYDSQFMAIPLWPLEFDRNHNRTLTLRFHEGKNSPFASKRRMCQQTVCLLTGLT